MARWLESATPGSALGPTLQVDRPDGATDTLDLLDKFVAFATNQSATSVAILAAGSGYQAGEIVALDDLGATYPAAFVNKTPLTIQVITVGGSGEILTLRMRNAGSYLTLPTGPFTTRSLNGTGTGATLTITFGAAPYTAVLDNTATEREVILESSAAGGPTFGIRTFGENIEIAGMPAGYLAANQFTDQVQISPGRHGVAGDDADGSYGLYRDLVAGTYNWFFAVDDRAIKLIANVDNANYPGSYLGFLDQQGPPSKYPTPLYLGACAAEPTQSYTDDESEWGGITLPIARINTNGPVRGPHQVYTPGGNWSTVRVGAGLSGNIVGTDGFGTMTPPGSHERLNPNLTDANRFFSVGKTRGWYDYANAPVTGGTVKELQAPARTIGFIPGTVNEHPRFDVFVHDVETEVAIYGTLREVFWVPREAEGGNLNAEDELVDANGIDLYKVFHNGRTTERQHWYAVKVTP